VATGTELWESAPEALEPLNTTGCGDAFTAALAHAQAPVRILRTAVLGPDTARARQRPAPPSGVIA
jgi:sugar/nucleoside kinase (ribokinase family)